MFFISLIFACTPKQPESIVSTNPPQRKPTYALPPTSMMNKELRKSWPPSPWKTAKAYAFNQQEFGPRAQLYAYKEGVWSTNITQEKELTTQQAHDALELTHRLGGTLRVSKCAFPRHAVVFFNEQEKPVASINICFQCGDILVWPPYSTEEDWNQQRFSQQGAEEMPLIFDAHEQMLPIWNTILIEQLALPNFTSEL
ncbi:MAG: hypothetical protein CL916_12970 [Deltaproteobacteria bacterium]|nr:hypothetical protein [Deltaproteobacteria bacterium]